MHGVHSTCCNQVNGHIYCVIIQYTQLQLQHYMHALRQLVHVHQYHMHRSFMHNSQLKSIRVHACTQHIAIGKSIILLLSKFGTVVCAQFKNVKFIFAMLTHPRSNYKLVYRMYNLWNVLFHYLQQLANIFITAHHYLITVSFVVDCMRQIYCGGWVVRDPTPCNQSHPIYCLVSQNKTESESHVYISYCLCHSRHLHSYSAIRGGEKLRDEDFCLMQKY